MVKQIDHEKMFYCVCNVPFGNRWLHLSAAEYHCFVLERDLGKYLPVCDSGKNVLKIFTSCVSKRVHLFGCLRRTVFFTS